MKNRVIAIIQARLQSTRLPSKVLLKINNKPMLWHVYNRLRKCKELDGIIVAIPKTDKLLHKYLHYAHMKHVTGSEDNVLERYVRAATYTNADVIVRITADCPMIDPIIVDSVIKYFNDHTYDYVCNTNDRPDIYERSKICQQTLDGFDVEVFSFLSLYNAHLTATDKNDLEHVTPYIVRNGNVDVWRYDKQLPKFHLSVNTQEDLDLVRGIFAKLGNKFSMEDALNEFSKINTISGKSKEDNTLSNANF